MCKKSLHIFTSDSVDFENFKLIEKCENTQIEDILNIPQSTLNSSIWKIGGIKKLAKDLASATNPPRGKSDSTQHVPLYTEGDLLVVFLLQV